VSAEVAARRGETISTYLEAHDAALLRARARDADRSTAAEVRVALRDYLNSEAALAGRLAKPRMALRYDSAV
jgi:hypothetical protein